MTAPVVQLLHVEFFDDADAATGGYWLARWTCERCGALGELAGARVDIDGVPLRQRGREHAGRHRCEHRTPEATPRPRSRSLVP